MLSPYKLQENDAYSYQFLTEQGITYSIYFIDYSVLFSDYPHLADFIYAFSIEVLDGDAKEAVADDRVGATIVEVFRLFFKKVQNVAVYVCDNMDTRQLARKRKFDSWFWKFNDGTILKEDGIAVIDGIEILNSLLIHRYNPHFADIILAYKELNARAGEK